MSTWTIDISIYGADSGWRRAIVTSVTVEANSKDQAIEAILSRTEFPNLTRADIFGASAA